MPTLDDMCAEGVPKVLHMDAIKYAKGTDLQCTGLIVGDYRVHCKHAHFSGSVSLGPMPDEQPLWVTPERAGPQVIVRTTAAVRLEEPGKIHLHPGAAGFETPQESKRAAERPATARRRGTPNGGMTGMTRP